MYHISKPNRHHYHFRRKIFAKILQIKTNYSGRASHLKLHKRLANLKSVTKKLRENKEMNWHFDIFYLTL